MKKLAVAFAIFIAASAANADRNDAAAEARRAAVDRAGAWANDGFKLRDGRWSGTLQPGRPEVIQVNLFEGNRYWFTAATAPGTGALSIGIFDESGQPVRADNYRDGTLAAVGFAPVFSGSYLVKLDHNGAHPAMFCLVYSYK